MRSQLLDPLMQRCIQHLPHVTEMNQHLTEKTYRKKSLLIHPDKLKHDRGIEAFDLLKKVSTGKGQSFAFADALQLIHPAHLPGHHRAC